MVRQFHRASSAVEGRNGYLSQRHHVQRGFWQNYSRFQVRQVHGLCQSIRVDRSPVYVIKLESAVSPSPDCNP